MALQHLNFSFQGIPSASIPNEWAHSGVVGSGDLELLIYRRDQQGLVNVRICTPVRGFDHVWELVLGRFVAESGCGDLDIEINDNNATPFVVKLRLQQALAEARGEDL
ncbi:malonate decarboxylase acyl carrier protein [Anaerotruncus rubiinfantis]|jgi:malonate decarboxylase delta subunit|uniref:malonate decarboxylase acyl carrier protein n=1 Tax=Anaerotruncus rubiinfantis TaxID=1720200 RepID=UPI00082BFAE5|nr:malonate decarboxylase acyl carrier protein [Anaerotruncus rubiinfantis]